MRLIALALALLLAGCAAERTQPSSGEDWTFTAIDGGVHAREDPAANATMLFFMATWCSSCRQKAPALSAVHDEYAPRGVRALSVDFDPTETRAELEAWQERYDQPWPHGIDEGLRLQRLYGVTTQSTVLVLDAGGDVVARFGYGPLDAQALRSALERALAPPA